jgi:hypothetical protein
MADSWEMSFLVDQTTQIQEARGNLARHFGMLQQVLIGKHLVNFIGADDRLAFLRMMGRLSQRSWHDTVACRLRTPLSGEKRVALQARPGNGPTAWWLMISEHGAETLPLVGEVETGDAMASEQEFGAVAAAAAGDTPGKLDLSVFRAAALAGASGAQLSESKHAELHQKIGETLRETATGGIVTQPAQGEYALVHDKEVPAHQIAERISVTADAVGVPAHALGLAHDSEPMPEDANAQEVRELIHTLRLDLAGRATGLKRHGSAYGTRQPHHGSAAPDPGERKPSFLASLLGLIGK